MVGVCSPTLCSWPGWTTCGLPSPYLSTPYNDIVRTFLTRGRGAPSGGKPEVGLVSTGAPSSGWGVAEGSWGLSGEGGRAERREICEERGG